MDLLGIIYEIFLVIWILLPPYTANGLAVLVGGSTPIDFGKKFIDGKRIFGDGKTWRGLFGASGLASICLLIQSLIENFIPIGPYHDIGPLNAIVMGFSFGLFALLGDLFESFIKRRLNLPRGYNVPIADQLDFVLSFIFFSYIFYREWAMLWLAPNRVLLAYLVTPPLHWGTNYLAYILGKKEVPW
ncbi:MAG TPA: CDP-2,3-bis-(O-geranylgeranyl)-sn-glycerol synthase [Euryarchaeota archaeon]|nr:CDP-2,3-bis-(O-geranylgeranyl)-sn-glycerol synthase [Euryarchaeota archaeon]